jgi:replicative DNA helicase Mcm
VSQTEQQLTEKFREFVRRYYDSRDGGDGRLDRLAQRYPNEQTSLAIGFEDLYQFDHEIAEDLLTAPDQLFAQFEAALGQYDLPADVTLSDVTVRLEDPSTLPGDVTYPVGAYPVDRISTLTHVRGQVTRVAESGGRFIEAAYECQRCGTMTHTPDGTEPHECQGCERQGPWAIRLGQSELIDHQLVRLQRPPEQSQTGARAATLDVSLEGDLVGELSPGDRVSVGTILEGELDDEDEGTISIRGHANSVTQQETSYEDLDIATYEDEIRRIANSDNPLQRVIDSIKPSHQGDDEIKKAIALQMFGGVDKELPDGSRKRGQSHILLIGDPGCDKSGLLEYAKRLSPRSVYTSGKNATSAGLTCAAVQTDFGDGGWTLEAGALVQAHRGLCAIDEFDKMDEEDRNGVQEALAQGTISPSKAGISDVTLPAETTVLAAANPINGRFDRFDPISEQINLDPTLISRFDLIFTMQDQPDQAEDEALAEHLNDVAQAGQRIAAGESIPEETKEAVAPAIDPDVLRHYIAYAKQECTPVLSEAAKERFNEFYVQTRASGADEDSPVPITARKLEALHRLGEAMARIRLSDTITEFDADRVIKLVRSCLESVGVDPETDELDADVIETGQSKAQRERVQDVKEAVNELAMQNENGAPEGDVVQKLVENGYTADEIESEIESLLERGDLYYAQQGHLRTV